MFHSFVTCPLRRRSEEIRAREAMKRCASSVSDISSEKKATGRFAFHATFSAMLQTRLDLPIAGRAAITIRLPGWKPPVMSSSLRKPDGVPVICVSPLASFSSRSVSWTRMSPSELKSPACSARATLKSSFSACSTSSWGSPSRVCTDCSIRCAAPSSRRSIEFCLTICA